MCVCEVDLCVCVAAGGAATMQAAQHAHAGLSMAHWLRSMQHGSLGSGSLGSSSLGIGCADRAVAGRPGSAASTSAGPGRTSSTARPDSTHTRRGGTRTRGDRGRFGGSGERTAPQSRAGSREAGRWIGGGAGEREEKAEGWREGQEEGARAGAREAGRKRRIGGERGGGLTTAAGVFHPNFLPSAFRGDQDHCGESRGD